VKNLFSPIQFSPFFFYNPHQHIFSFHQINLPDLLSTPIFFLGLAPLFQTQNYVLSTSSFFEKTPPSASDYPSWFPSLPLFLFTYHPLPISSRATCFGKCDFQHSRLDLDAEVPTICVHKWQFPKRPFSNSHLSYSCHLPYLKHV